MPRNYYESKLAICPFYLRDTGKTVSCEGISSNSCLQYTFKTGDEKKEHKEKFCNSYDYRKCEWAGRKERDG